MRIIFYALDLLRMIAQDSLSGSSERLFQRGKGRDRIHRSFCSKDYIVETQKDYC